MKNRIRDYPKRVCHNPNCGLLYEPRRFDAKHCDRICADRCRACHAVYEKAAYKRIALEKRRSLKGLSKKALDLVKAQVVNRGDPEDVEKVIAELEALKANMEAQNG